MSTNSISTICAALLLMGSAAADDLQRPDPGKKIHVFILAGQSNMEGRADGRKLSEEDRARLALAQERVQLAFNHEPIRPLDVVTPSDEIAEIYKVDRIFGPELFFGIALAEAMPDERFLLIKRTVGATSLHGAWNPKWSEDKAALMEESDGPRLYEDMTAYVKDVLGGYGEDEYVIRGMLWVQGESDGKVEEAAAKYGENLRMLIQSARSDFRVESLPFVLMQVGRDQVIEGMKRTASETPNVVMIPQSLDAGSPDSYSKMENGHFDNEGLKKVGERFARIFIEDFPPGGD